MAQAEFANISKISAAVHNFSRWKEEGYEEDTARRQKRVGSNSHVDSSYVEMDTVDVKSSNGSVLLAPLLRDHEGAPSLNESHNLAAVLLCVCYLAA